MSRRAITISLVMAFVVSFFGYPVHAVTSEPQESITLTPTNKTYKVDAGQTLDDSITILNDGQTAYDVTVYGAPYAVTDGNYDPVFTSKAPNSDAYSWLQFSQTTWHVASRQTVTIPYTLHVRKDAAPGGHYGVIFVEVQPSSGDKNNLSSDSLSRKKRVGCVIYATVNGDVHLGGNVTNSSIPWFQSSPPLQASTSVRNTGNTDFDTTAELRVNDIFGDLKYDNKNTYKVLPSTTSNITLQWANARWLGLYKVSLATTALGHTTTIQSYVLILPTWLILLVGVLLIAGGVYVFRRRTQQKTS